MKKNFFVIIICLICLLSFLVSCKDKKSSESEHKTVLYTVEFDYNDGSGKIVTVDIPSGESIERYAPYPVSGMKEVTSWSLVVDGSHFIAPVTENIRLFATWTDFSHEKVVYTENIPDMITSRFVSINAQNQSVLSGKTLVIAASVKKIEFISTGIIFDNLTLILGNRVDDIYVSFEDFCFNSSYFCAFDASGVQGCVNLNIKGNNAISCVATNANWNKGADCIRANNINIEGVGHLYLQAGVGVNGENKATAGNGQDGENGGKGQDGGSGIVASKISVNNIELTVVAGNGGNGGNGGAGNNSGGVSSSGKKRKGGNGGNAGKGGNAIETLEFFATNANLNFTAGNGGNGGVGGHGGGSSGVFAGPGGIGGNGGYGGNVFSNVINSSNIINGVRNFVFGVGGKAGEGGASASSSLHGVAGVTGLPGKTNCN